MGDRKILDKRIGQTVNQTRQRNGRRVGSYDGVLFAVLIDPPVKVLLDGKVFDNSLYDEITVGQSIEVIFDIAGRDPSGVPSVHEGCRIDFEHFLDSALCNRVAV